MVIRRRWIDSRAAAMVCFSLAIAVYHAVVSVVVFWAIPVLLTLSLCACAFVGYCGLRSVWSVRTTATELYVHGIFGNLIQVIAWSDRSQVARVLFVCWQRQRAGASYKFPFCREYVWIHLLSDESVKKVADWTRQALKRDVA